MHDILWCDISANAKTEETMDDNYRSNFNNISSAFNGRFSDYIDK